MISICLQGVWHELDTLNGCYRLDDLFRAAGKPEGRDPRAFVEHLKPHKLGTIQVRNKYVWSNQAKVYQYAAWLDVDFKDTLVEVLKDYPVLNLELAKTIATGVDYVTEHPDD